MKVAKTLVIGLGSTGTQIADSVATRVRWELGSLAKAPWLSFLCVETNASEKDKVKTLSDSDFRDLSISAQEFAQLVDRPEIYDDAIGLSQWIHSETIKKLPGQEVTAGVGNIRMLGRLAFLFPKNFEKIQIAVTGRLAALRDLTDHEARTRRGKLANGEDPQVDFANGGMVRVVVAGTLCGGTCSGLASDFGYFLRSLILEDESTTAIFTLPNEKLTSVDTQHAERFKKNAYHALVELNHYHLAGRGKENDIRFSNGKVADSSKFPYDLTYLVMPKETDRASETRLNNACGDRIFMDIFTPPTSPFADAVNATVYTEDAISDRDHRAHVFSTFGLSTVEFPAQQVTEAATKLLIAYTLSSWLGRSVSTADDIVDQLGFSWGDVKEVFLRTAMNGQFEEELGRRQREVQKSIGVDPEAALEALAKLRSAFRRASEDFDVQQELSRVSRSVSDEILQRVRDFVSESLRDFDRGPMHVREGLSAIRRRLSDLKSASPRSYASEQGMVDEAFERIAIHLRNGLLTFVRLRNVVVDAESNSMRRALSIELDARVDRAIHSVLVGSNGSGLLTRLDRQIETMQRRIEGLRTRATDYVNASRSEADNLSQSLPNINGVALFTAGQNDGGTVRTEYQRCIEVFFEDRTLTFEEARDMLARDVIASWTAMAHEALPGEQPETDVFLEPKRTGYPALPKHLETQLLDVAVRPFRRLTQIDVLRRWIDSERTVNQHLDRAKEAADRSHPFLAVSQALAMQGGRSPVPTRQFVLLPASNADAAKTFITAVEGKIPNVSKVESPEMYRIVMLQEMFRFPLSGCTSVLSGGVGTALESAQSNDFPFYWTRSDVGWTGISDREIKRSRRAEEVLTIAILMGEAEPKGGRLVIPWESGLVGKPTRQLPLDFHQAVQQLAREEFDVEGDYMPNALGMLDLRIEKQCELLDEDKRVAAKKFVQMLANNHNEGRGGLVDNWARNKAWPVVKRYLASKEDLFKALSELDPVPTAVLAKCRKRAGDPDPHGGRYKEDGYYCPAASCGGLIGRTEEEAARNGWRCYVRPDEHNLENAFGQSY